jgi:hypothetical protein
MPAPHLAFLREGVIELRGILATDAAELFITLFEFSAEADGCSTKKT